MKRITFLVFASLLIFSLVNVQAVATTNNNNPADDRPCVQIVGCPDFQDDKEPEQTNSHPVSSGLGGGDMIMKENKPNFGVCYNGIWGEVRPMILSGTVDLVALINIFNKQEYNVCKSHFWLDIRPLFVR